MTTSITQRRVAQRGRYAAGGKLGVAGLLAFTALLCMLLAACTPGLVKSSVEPAEVPKDERAQAIYEAARRCWSSKDYILVAGTVVESRVTLDGIVVAGRWTQNVPFVDQSPFLEFVIQGDEQRSTVEIRERPNPYLGKAGYRQDAQRWAKGDYTCRRKAA